MSWRVLGSHRGGKVNQKLLNCIGGSWSVMRCDLRGLLGVPGGSYRILTTLKGIWRILEGGEFLSGP